MRSVELWRDWLDDFGINTSVTSGTLHVAHDQDLPLLTELCEKLNRRFQTAEPRLLNFTQLCEFEPSFAIARYRTALLLPHDGFLRNHQVLTGLQQAIESSNIQCRMPLAVTRLTKDRIFVHDEASEVYDKVFDCRGLRAQSDLATLRGVRGELIEVTAPEVDLKHAVHVVHGRYPIYIVPRGGSRYAIGATQLESESLAPISVKSAMELLSTAYTAHPGFRYANIVNMVANCRPAFADHLPKIVTDHDIWRLNGLFRYGFLMTPILVATTIKALQDRQLDAIEQRLLEPNPSTDKAGDTYWN
jgi:glycine oxidase